MMSGPLSDLQVVELSAFVAAPLGGMTLAQLGADVIRIDPIGGNIDFRRWPLGPQDLSLYWAGLNKGKRSIALALDTAEGRKIAQSLILAPGEGTGILLTNLPAADWSSYSRLSSLRADLILARLMGNFDGSSAVDYTVNCASGFPFITGCGPLPVNHVLPAWDIAAGLYVATGVLAAERQRSRTGRGQEVTIALSDVMLATLGNLGYLADFEVNHSERERLGNAIYGAFGADFPTADHRRVMIVAITTRQWRNLMEATGLGTTLIEIASADGLDFDDEGDRFRGHAAIRDALSPWVAARTLDELREVLERHRVLWGPYQDIRQLMNEDPRCSPRNPLFERLEQPGVGKHLVPRSPLSFTEIRTEAPRLAPRLGQNTDEILRDVIGCSEAEILRLRRGSIVA
jgi:2-methylfumaryl-CoA isomerase